MKPMLIAVVSAILSGPMFPGLPGALRDPAAVRNPAASKIAPTDLGRLVWLAKADAAGTLTRTDFVFSRPERGIRIMADPAALRGGLTRLMSLSADSMNKSARRRLGVRVSSAPGGVTLELRDEGPGMTVQDIVSMYGAGDSPLSDARRRIESAGGVINVSSKSGVGTVYLIDFPAAMGS